MARKVDPEQIIRTKLHRPPTDRDHLHRGPLLDRLNRSRHRPLVLVSAPAGYGKSTLVSCWLETCNIPGAWVSLDENDNDLRIFLVYFVSAIQRIFPAACRKTLSLLKAAHLPPVWALAASLVNELEQINKAFVLALDDYHLIRDKSVHGLVTNLLNHPSAMMRLVLIGRRDPPLPLTSLRARGQMVEIRTQDLRFTTKETRMLLQQMTGAPVDTSVAAILEDKIEGWVTGLRLAALSLRHRRDIKRTLTDVPAENRYVMDYVLAEILSDLPPALQDCVLKTSVLNRFCAPLCDAVCFSDEDADACEINGRKLLDLLEKESLFVIPLDDENKWYRYHHLFQALLKRLLKQRSKTEDILKLYKQASDWFAQKGYIEEALSHAFKGGDIETAARLVSHHRHDIMNREQWYHLNRWLQRFPPDYIQEDLDLLLAKAWVLQRQARYSELFEILDGLESNAATSQKNHGTVNIYRGEIQTFKSFRHFSAGRAKSAEISAREALDGVPARYHSIRGFAIIILALALQMRGDPGQARHVVHAALQQEEASTAVYKTMLLAALCYMQWIAADLNSLKTAAAQLLRHGHKKGLPETIAVGRFFSGIRHYQRNELDQAERFLAPVVGSPVAGELVVPSIVTYCQSSFALSLTYQATGRPREAGEIIESVIDYMLETGNTELLEICQAFQADLALRQGRSAVAELWARNYTSRTLIPVYRFYTPLLVFPGVLLARRTAKSLREAEALLSRIYDYYLPLHSTRVLIDVLVLQSQIHAARGDMKIALEKLVEALDLAEPGGFIRPFLDPGPEMADLFAGLVKQHPDVRYARRILAAFDSEKPGKFRNLTDDRKRSAASVSSPTLLDPLTNREIEVLKVLAKGISNQEIADCLCISPETVKRHLSTIYSKLDVKNRQQAVISARSIGIL